MVREILIGIGKATKKGFGNVHGEYWLGTCNDPLQ